MPVRASHGVSYAARFFASLKRLPDQIRTVRSAGGLYAPANPGFEPDRYAYDRGRKTFPDDIFLKIEKRRAELFTTEGRETLRTLVAETADVIARMRDDAEAAGARFVVVVIPDELQVNDVLRRNVEQARGGQGIDADGTEQIVAEALDVREIDYVETVYELRREAQEVRSPYGTNDTHWDARGNEIAGHVLAEHLLEDH